MAEFWEENQRRPEVLHLHDEPPNPKQKAQKLVVSPVSCENPKSYVHWHHIMRENRQETMICLTDYEAFTILLP